MQQAAAQEALPAAQEAASTSSSAGEVCAAWSGGGSSRRVVHVGLAARWSMQVVYCEAAGGMPRELRGCWRHACPGHNPLHAHVAALFVHSSLQALKQRASKPERVRGGFVAYQPKVVGRLLQQALPQLQPGGGSAGGHGAAEGGGRGGGGRGRGRGKQRQTSGATEAAGQQ